MPATSVVKIANRSFLLPLLRSLVLSFILLVTASSLQASPLPFTPLPSDAAATILSGRILSVPSFLPPALFSSLKADARSLFKQGLYTPDALAKYGAKKDGVAFDPRRDRTVLPAFIPSSSQTGPFLDPALGDYEARQELQSTIDGLRATLSVALSRPALSEAPARPEISFTRFGPGAYLKRHTDERHEELKRAAGWSDPTRRSVSWLIYLNDDDWDPATDGGCLRTFQRLRQPPSHSVGALDGDLQIGWLAAVATDPVDRPVFLDARRARSPSNNCALYTGDDENRRAYVTSDFKAEPVLFLTTDFFINLLQKDLQHRFHYLDLPKNALLEKFNVLRGKESGKIANPNEIVRDIAPTGNTLVLFDSVCLPHEVLAATRDRFACSGWLREKQQPPMRM